MYQDIDLTFDSQVVEVNLVCGRLPELTRFFFFFGRSVLTQIMVIFTVKQMINSL